MEEVIQIDTESLLPYMQNSKERERNEALAENLQHNNPLVNAEMLLAEQVHPTCLVT